MLAKTPAPPYYAVIFTSMQNDNLDGYAEMAAQMLQLAEQQEGYLGIESAREAVGITVSYWRDLESIRQWRAHAEHKIAQQMGREQWYSCYQTRIALVERDYRQPAADARSGASEPTAESSPESPAGPPPQPTTNPSTGPST